MSVPCAPPALPARASISGRQRGQRRVLCSAAAHTRLPDPLLLSLGVDDAATGGAQLAQSALADALAAGITSGYLPCDPASLGQGTAAQAASARALLLGAGVLRRGSQRGAEQYFVTTPGLPALAADSLLDRLHLAAARALQRWVDGGGQGAAGITHLVLGSITPPRSAPGPDVALLARLGLPASCQRVPQHHLGCHGALRALALAAQIARGDPLARVLVVYGDVMSTLGAFMPTPLAAEDLRSVAVFTDGAAAAVVAGCEGEGLGVPLARIIAARSELLSEEGAAGADALRLRARYNDATAGLALQMTLPVDWAQQTGALIGPFAQALLSDCAARTGTDAPLLARCLVALHPSTEAALSAAAAAMHLAPWQAAPGCAVLASRGNPSGAGALMALAVALDSARLGPQAPLARRPKHVLALALGPGVSGEGLVLQI